MYTQKDNIHRRVSILTVSHDKGHTKLHDEQLPVKSKVQNPCLNTLRGTEKSIHKNIKYEFVVIASPRETPLLPVRSNSLLNGMKYHLCTNPARWQPSGQNLTGQ